jgi:hypothetical protein
VALGTGGLLWGEPSRAMAQIIDCLEVSLLREPLAAGIIPLWEQRYRSRGRVEGSRRVLVWMAVEELEAVARSTRSLRHVILRLRGGKQWCHQIVHCRLQSTTRLGT